MSMSATISQLANIVNSNKAFDPDCHLELVHSYQYRLGTAKLELALVLWHAEHRAPQHELWVVLPESK